MKSASFILLQGVPPTVSLDRVRQAIRRVPGVLSIHELHVWQLSESKLIASVHVCISSRADYMEVQTRIRKVLHDQGMHSSTIQPEVYQPESEVSEDDLVVSSLTKFVRTITESTRHLLILAVCLHVRLVKSAVTRTTHAALLGKLPDSFFQGPLHHRRYIHSITFLIIHYRLVGL